MPPRRPRRTALIATPLPGAPVAFVMYWSSGAAATAKPRFATLSFLSVVTAFVLPPSKITFSSVYPFGAPSQSSRRGGAGAGARASAGSARDARRSEQPRLQTADRRLILHHAPP